MVNEAQQKCAIRIQVGPMTWSGWLLYHEKITYLISAKHVFFEQWRGSDHRYSKECIIVGFDSIEADFSKTFTLKIDLEKAAAEGYFRKHPQHDLVAIALFLHLDANNFTVLDYIQSKGKFDCAPGIVRYGADTLDMSKVIVAADSYVCGYPSSVAKHDQLDASFPIVAKGIVASKKGTNSRIILSVPVFPGNSGCPVSQLEQVEIDIGTVQTYKVIGTVTEYVPWENKQGILENSGFSVVEPMEVHLELAKLILDQITRDGLIK